ncbi:MAG TPA: biotin-dependent carboxyltransferase family protein [Tahibacter sp.]|uniref:5-oxoprolinase subunit C family protein n=1 Tax=Tahibacter sp. TaxID=2056211 RepID=UPI002D1B9F38|nr:biotin-dependent carboxyltransferase family protein [Tahibacter sp.]HSX59989.1 biotin-dependent carboxyltransferase family protein [Tahibacter sp.]
MPERPAITVADPMITVLRPGLLSSLQDLGRRGHAAIGLGASGAMDPTLLRIANWLVGNDDDAAAIECTLLGPRLRFDVASVIAWCGADSEALLDGRHFPTWRPVPVEPGSVLDLAALRRGARGYLAVAGGIAVAPVLGSRSVDLNAGIGPCEGRALRAGDRLALNAAAEPAMRAPSWSVAPSHWLDTSAVRVLRVLRGSHHAALDPRSRDALTGERFRVAADSNRVGVRLTGPTLALQEPLELVSAAATRGTVQLPPSGQPIMLAAEHPTTGGYPRIAHLIDADHGALAQCRPGDHVLLRLVDADEAESVRRRRAAALARLRDTVRQRRRESGCDEST